ncbi:restriction endonuclease subunit S [Mariprofundus sp. EBB-1]|uniref:restriction endonuclease subunit S n=1 Tax=Mariprofundus sp. EBB-1 TaxID=2650971 RepID=UPI000EF25A03|nr:restriction endonuclease subunit S [Mariprofundus sp. EBB-1]RLL50703.1 restriction endonuclease subunit S [Mariprofundus sp. EBB-1]
MSSLPEGWIKTSLGEVTYYASGKMPISEIDLDNYISTENLLVDKMGVTQAAALPKVSKVNAFDVGDTLFSNIRTYFKKVWYSNKIGGSSNDVLVFRPIDNEQLNKKYLYYLISNDGFIEYTVITAKGTKMPRGDKDAIKQYPLRLPTLSEQKAIADMLSSFDEKIELLRAQNKTLETLAQTVFKEWFVNFNYPDETGEMVDSELGEIPKGWRIGSFDEVIEFSNGYAFKSKELIKEPANNSFAVFKMGHIKKGGGFNPSKTKDYIAKEKCVNLSRFVLKKGDILMCMTDMKDSTSLLGHTALMFDNEYYIVNQRVGLIRARNEVNIDYPWLYILTNSIDFISDLRKRANSGVQVNLSTSEIKNSRVIIPNIQTNIEFDKLAKPIFEKIQNNAVQIQSLSKTRDALLPKLMNGHVRIHEFSREGANDQRIAL